MLDAPGSPELAETMPTASGDMPRAQNGPRGDEFHGLLENNGKI